MELPAWPPDWVEDHVLEMEQVVAQSEDVSLATAARNDGRVLLSVSWPDGRRYMLLDPEGGEMPVALRAGEVSEDAAIRTAVDALWSRALEIGKQLLDGELQLPGMAGEEPSGRRRRWRRGAD
jgi:hypothetical protein